MVLEGKLLQMEKLGQLITLDEQFNLIYRERQPCLFSVCMPLSDWVRSRRRKRLSATRHMTWAWLLGG